jgi:hypothetical protein
MTGAVPLPFQTPGPAPAATPAAAAPSAIDLDIEIERERLRLSNPMPAQQAIDRKKGAPVRVRATVGAAQTDEDRLATIQRFYPDAQPYEGDNFVYTDPRTNRPTLYNEENPTILGIPIPSLGDIVSAGPEIAETLGGMAGGIAAAPAALATGGTGALAVPAGIGLGAAGGREAYTLLSQALLGTQDTRTLPQRATDAAVTGGVNAVAGPLADRAIGTARAVLGPVNQQVAGAFNRLGIQPMAGHITGNRGVQTAEHGLSNTLGGAPIIGEAVDRSVAGTEAAATRLAEGFAQGGGRGAAGAGPQTVEELGGTMRQAAKDAAGRFEQRAETLYRRASAAIGPGRPAAIPQSSALRTELENQVRQAPESLGPVLGPVIERIARLEADAAAGMPFEALRRVRTAIGRELDDPVLVGGTGAQKDALRALYGRLTDDMFETARRAGPDAERALAVADRYYRFNMGQNMPLLQKIVDSGTDGEVLALAMRGSGRGGQQLMRVRRNFTADEWDAVAGTVLGRMGRATPGQQGASELGQEAMDFSVNTFLTNWNKLAPEAQKALFGGTRYRDLADPLNDLVKVVGAMKDSAKLANTSGTARSVGVQSAVGAGGAAIGGLLGGDVESAGQGSLWTLLGVTVGARYASKLITNPRFVRWLGRTAQAAQRNPASLRAALPRLAAIATAEPDIREAVHQYLGSLGVPVTAGPATQ